MRITTNKNKELVEKINAALNKNLEKYGKRYCPCNLIHDDDHVCPCKEFINSTGDGYCHCGKYYKEMED